MLLKLSEWLTKNHNIYLPHRGIVIENNDPRKLRRIKVTIDSMLEGSVDQLPWIYPRIPYFLGGGANAVLFSIPEIGSEVEVTFPFEDVYFGFYTGHWATASHPTDFDADYPDVYGFIDSAGNFLRINKKTGTFELKINGTATISVSGDVTLNIDGNVTFTASGDVSATVGGNASVTVTGDSSLISTGKVNIVGNPINLNE